MKNLRKNDFEYLEPERIRIKAKDIKARIGHQEHDQGCGKHDSRPKRKRTRQTQKRAWLEDY